MSTGLLTHKLMRVAKRDRQTEVMHKGGKLEVVERTTWERTCLCGRVFVGGSELLSIGYFLAHLPKPETAQGGHGDH